MDCVALIMAAGSGVRLGGERPKQYRKLGGLPMLRRSIMALQSCPAIAQVRAVIGPGQQPLYEAATAGLDLPPPVPGGATRQASVRAGLEALEALGPRHVLVHDAARPFATPALVARVVAALDGAPAVLPALAVVDTLKRVDAAGRVIGVTIAEAPRRGRIYTTAPETVRLALASSGVQPASFAVGEPVTTENYGRVADSLRRDLRVAQVTCVKPDEARNGSGL